MTCETNVSEFKQLRISSSVHEMRVSFSTTWASDVAMISFDDFIIYTSRDRKNALNFFWTVIDASLKFSLIHSANFVWNESHRSSSSSSSHSRILFSSMWVLDSYFFFDFSLSSSSICSSLSVDFSLSRVEARLRLEDGGSDVICRFARVDAGLQRWERWMRSRRIWG
jgi:hypothetical protein